MKHDVGPHYGTFDLGQWVRVLEVQSYVAMWSMYLFEADAVDAVDGVQIALEDCR